MRQPCTGDGSTVQRVDNTASEPPGRLVENSANGQNVPRRIPTGSSPALMNPPHSPQYHERTNTPRYSACVPEEFRQSAACSGGASPNGASQNMYWLDEGQAANGRCSHSRRGSHSTLSASSCEPPPLFSQMCDGGARCHPEWQRQKHEVGHGCKVHGCYRGSNCYLCRGGQDLQLCHDMWASRWDAYFERQAELEDAIDEMSAEFGHNIQMGYLGAAMFDPLPNEGTNVTNVGL